MTVTKSTTISGITEEEKKLISEYAKDRHRLTFSAFMIQSALERINQEKEASNDNSK